MFKDRLLWMKKNIRWTILFVLFTIFLFSNFSNSYLWSDEGATASIAKNTLEFGIPKIYDGMNWVKPAYVPSMGWVTGGESYDSDLISTEHAWGQYYLAAASFSVFGFTTFAARLPFVVASFVSLFLIFHLFALLYPKRDPGKNKVTFLAMVLLFTSTFFFLISRQARMYPLVLLFTTLLLVNYIQLLRGNKKRYVLGFSLASILLFYSQFYVFFMTMLTVAVHFIFFTKLRKKLAAMVLVSVLIAVFTLPWFLLYFSFGNFSFSILDSLFLFRTIIFLFREINFSVPIIFFAMFPLLLFIKKKNEDQKFRCNFIFVFSVVPLLVLALFWPERFFKHIFGFAPIILLGVSTLFFWAANKGRFFRTTAVALLLLFMFTNLVSWVPFAVFSTTVDGPVLGFCHKLAPTERQEMDGSIIDARDRCDSYVGRALSIPDIQFPILYFIYEITHDFDGPNEGIVKFLDENAKEGDVLFTAKEYYPLIFYTDQQILGPLQYYDDAFLKSEGIDKPDWIIPRWPDYYPVNYLGDYAIQNNYTPITLSYPNYWQGNMPYMIYHFYWTPNTGSNMTIYKNPDYVA